MRDVPNMRTTLDIEADVLLAVKQLARQRREPMGRLVSELVREALIPRTQGQERNGVPLFPVTAPSSVITLDFVNQLRDEAP